MMRSLARLLLICIVATMTTLVARDVAHACPTVVECPPELDESAVRISLEGAGVAGVAGATGTQAVDYAWRLIDPCLAAADARDYCSPTDVRTCPPEPNRIISYLVAQNRPIVRVDGTVLVDPDNPAGVPAPPGAQPGTPVGAWSLVREGCFDITLLNPPPSGAEVFSYFQRLPLPTLTTQHQPPGNGLSGLPVIFYTDSPTTQTFTVDVRGFTVVIEAKATQYTWHTGDPAAPTVVSTDPGRPYPNETVEHDYRSGTYTAYLTVTWGATFTVNGSEPQNVPGTASTDGPPVTFDVLQARPVLTNPYN
jgi:hypothetical protein